MKKTSTGKKNRITLGIETSCDETSVAVLKGPNRLLSNIIASSLKEHRPYGGVVPEIASRSHLETLVPCLDLALKKAGCRLRDIDLIAATQGPGLMGSLLVGLTAAKALSLSLKKPLIGVDHVIAHIYGATLNQSKIDFPCLGLVVSGGHTLLLRIERPDRIRLLGRTMDDAAGEAFDKVAKILGLGYPGGPEIQRMAARADGREKIYFSPPYLKEDSLNFSFSGIKTAVLYKAQELRQKARLDIRAKRAICAGFQTAVCETLSQKTLRAALDGGLKTVIVGGGVSANRQLRQRLTQATREHPLRVIFPPLDLCQDNAGMVACLGRALYDRGIRHSLDLEGYSDFYGFLNHEYGN